MTEDQWFEEPSLYAWVGTPDAVPMPPAPPVSHTNAPRSLQTRSTLPQYRPMLEALHRAWDEQEETKI